MLRVKPPLTTIPLNNAIVCYVLSPVTFEFYVHPFEDDLYPTAKYACGVTLDDDNFDTPVLARNLEEVAEIHRNFVNALRHGRDVFAGYLDVLGDRDVNDGVPEIAEEQDSPLGHPNLVTEIVAAPSEQTK